MPALVVAPPAWYRRMDDVCNAHHDELRHRNYSEGTVKQRCLLLGRLNRFLGGRSLLYATTDDLRAFRDRKQLDGRRLAVSTQACELAHLRSFYKWCLINDVIDVDPTLKIPAPKLPRLLPHPLPEHELTRALNGASARVVPWLYLAAYAGLRACEVAPLRAEDLWWHHAPPSIFIVRGKGGDPGIVPIAPILEPVLRSLPRKGWLFPKQDGSGGPVQAHTVSHLANRDLHRLGIDLTFHSLRHRFGTQVYRASGRDLRQTQELMRHKTPVSTAGYTMIDQSEAAGIVAALPGGAT